MIFALEDHNNGHIGALREQLMYLRFQESGSKLTSSDSFRYELFSALHYIQNLSSFIFTSYTHIRKWNSHIHSVAQ